MNVRTSSIEEQPVPRSQDGRTWWHAFLAGGAVGASLSVLLILTVESASPDASGILRYVALPLAISITCAVIWGCWRRLTGHRA